MSGGEVTFEVFKKVTPKKSRPVPTDVPAFSQRECCFQLPVFADLSLPDDIYRNDKHSIQAAYDGNLYSDVSIFIQKWENGAWVDKVELANSFFGTLYDYSYVNSGDTYYIAYIADFNKILFNFGVGSYRFRYKEIDFSAVETETIYPFEFCLRSYNDNFVDRTVRFETYTNGIAGDVNSDLDTFDYRPLAEELGGEGWFGQWRLPESFFGYNKSAYQREFVRYQNGQEVWLQDEQIESYTWNSGQYPALLHDYIKIQVLQSDRIFVTDYNSNNPNVIKEKAVNASSNYEPNWQYNNRRAFVDVDFTQEFQNRRKKRC